MDKLNYFLRNFHSVFEGLAALCDLIKYLYLNLQRRTDYIAVKINRHSFCEVRNFLAEKNVLNS